MLDNFGNTFMIYSTIYSPIPSIPDTYNTVITIDLSSAPKEVCYNFIQVAKENSENLWLIRNSTDDVYYGDKYCTSGVKCLKDLKLDNFESFFEEIKSAGFAPDIIQKIICLYNTSAFKRKQMAHALEI